VPYHWSIHQLTEYFGAVTAQADEAIAARVAVERAVEALGAEVGALVSDNNVSRCVGMGRQSPPQDEFMRAADGALTFDVAGLGVMNAASAPLDGDISGRLVVGRIDDAFTGEERQLLQSMASVLGLALRSLRTLDAERALRAERERVAAERLQLLDTLEQRQRLLESLLAIQRAISHRAPLQSVLDAVTNGAAGLLTDAFVALVMTDADGKYRVTSACPADDISVHRELVIATATAALTGAVLNHSDVGPAHVHSALAAPVHIEGEPAGCLVTVNIPTDAPAADRQETLAAFAEQASLALTDARTVEAMQDAYHDSLTGLPTRALFLDRLNHALARSVRYPGQVTVLFIDLDRFKDVNDSLGHAAGDELLAIVGHRVRNCVRAEDTAARLGGDEFAVLLERTVGEDPGRDVAERIMRALQEPVQVGGREVFTFASIGIATSGADADTADALLRNADIAMYSAKRNRARTALTYVPSMHAETMLGLELGTDLHHAVARGELRLQYQPLVNLETGAPLAVEALVRWDHPKHGPIPPNVFIPIAERNGLIVDVGAWVLRRACEQTAAWRAASLPEIRISVNVSGRQLDDDAFPGLVEAILRETALPPSVLTLEVTESVLMQEPERTLERLAPLKTLGVRLAIDDFGTGYSSLASLQRFQPDQLKIDKAFIDKIETSPADSAILAAVVAMARTLDLETVAEGIETRQQWGILRDLACDLGQGFHFARPVGPEEILQIFITAASLRSIQVEPYRAAL